MDQLELRLYSRQEIADILAVNINDNKHFKRNIENKLTQWGYSYKYSTKQVEITAKPQTAEDKLKEIFIRVYDIDVRTDIYSMACFLVMLMNYDEFQSMPWDERAVALNEEYGVNIASITLKKWYSQLLKKDMVASCKYDRTYWATMYINGEKARIMVTGDEALESCMRKYYKRRKELVSEYKDMAYKANRIDTKTINSEAWSYTFKMLWEEFHCCYYACGSVYLNALGEHAQEIFELVEEISESRKPYKEKFNPFTNGNKTNEFIF